jgi:hypothetical protein
VHHSVEFFALRKTVHYCVEESHEVCQRQPLIALIADDEICTSVSKSILLAIGGTAQ